MNNNPKSDPQRSQVPAKRKGFSLARWFARKFGLTHDNNFVSNAKNKAIEDSIDIIASKLSDGEVALEGDEREMIHGVVELGETTVKEIMIPRVDIIGVEVGTPLRDVISVINKTGHSRIPLYDESLDDIKGMLYAKDLLSCAIDELDIDLIKISRKPYFIPENKKVDDLLRELRKKHIHISIVVDEYGGTSGLVTMEDIIEEIVGEIEDEYDQEPPPVSRLSPGQFLVDGSLSLSDLNKEIDIDLPEREFETVGGLIYDLVGSLPEKGRKLSYHGVTFIVEEIEGQRIVAVKILIDQKPPSEKSI